MQVRKMGANRHPQPSFRPYDLHSSSVVNISTVDGTLAMDMMSYANNLAEQYSSLDGSDTFMSCNTHPYPSQGSLAGLEELAAKGSMAANGSMPSVNISGFNNHIFNGNSVFSTLFDPRRRSPPSPKGNHHQPSPNANHHRRVRIASRSLSSDNELEAWADCIEEGEKRYHDDSEPKHRRSRHSHSVGRPRPRFDLEGTNQVEFDPCEDDKPRHSYMSTRGLAAVYQGLASLGEKLGKGNKYCTSGPIESMNLSALKTSPTGQRKKSILKKSDSLGARAVHPDPERENLLVSDPESLNGTPLAPRKFPAPSAKYGSNIRSTPPPHCSLPNVHGEARRYGGASTGTPPSSSFTSDELLDERGGYHPRTPTKDIQTSTTTLAQSIAASGHNTKATNTTKFERGRDPCHSRDIGISAKTAAVRDDSGIGFESSNRSTAPTGPRCTNQSCRINKPSSASSTVTKTVCICGHPMVATVTSPPEELMGDMEGREGHSIHLADSSTSPSEVTRLLSNPPSEEDSSS